jgi:hypothetical protein
MELEVKERRGQVIAVGDVTRQFALIAGALEEKIAKSGLSPAEKADLQRDAKRILEIR